MHDEGLKRLTGELDILNFVNASRVVRFLSQLYMSRNHRYMVRYFRLYSLDANNLFLPTPEDPTVEELLSKFDPE